jgi:putative phosphoribosyl transferase
MKLFTDRRHAGRALGERLRDLSGRPDVVVLGLPRGGIPVAFEVATALQVPLDVFTVRKIGAPWSEEFAIGALASGGMMFLDEQTMFELGLRPRDIEPVIARERVELARRERLYRDARPFPDLANKIVILVDDGLATGSTMRAAVSAVRTRHPSRVIVAAPVASRQANEILRDIADRCVTVAVPEPFYGVGLWYDDFSETSDREVLALLDQPAVQEFQPAAL